MNATIALLKIVCIENNSSLTAKVHSSVSTRFSLFLFESNIFKRLSTKAKALQKSLCVYVCIVFRSHTMSRWCCTHTHTRHFFFISWFLCVVHTPMFACVVLIFDAIFFSLSSMIWNRDSYLRRWMSVKTSYESNLVQHGVYVFHDN